MYKHDPVCGRRLKHDQAHATIYYHGEPYDLCSPLCKAIFELNPGRYVLEAAWHRQLDRTRKRLAHR